MALRGFERRLERLLEGTFSRVFRGELRPVEIARRITHEMDDHRSVGVTGQLVAPNHFEVDLSPEDHARFAEAVEPLRRELCEVVRQHAADEDYALMGPVDVELRPAGGLRSGSFEVRSRLRGGPQLRAHLVSAGGERVSLAEGTVTIGRAAGCTLMLDDRNVSRNHAEIRPSGPGHAIVDLGSTNGTLVNGMRVASHQLQPGDQITLGSTVLWYQLD